MSHKKRQNFYESEDADEIRALLISLQEDVHYKTDASYNANTDKYPDHLMPFVEKHMEYLNTHPDVNPTQYIANLRLVTKLR